MSSRLVELLLYPNPTKKNDILNIVQLAKDIIDCRNIKIINVLDS